MTDEPDTAQLTLFKYMEAKHAITVIETGLVKVSLPGQLNDPYDVSPHFVAGALGTEELVGQLQRRWKHQIHKFFGMVCFSCVIDDPVVWTHYADVHQGVALEFAFPPGIADEVHYGNERPKITYATYRDTWREETFAALTTKWESWSYEKEYRYILDLRDCELRAGMHFTRKPVEYLTGVILGERCPLDTAHLSSLLDQHKFSGVGVKRARLSPDTFEMVVE